MRAGRSWSATCAAARRADVHRACLPSGRPRRRYLAVADAGPNIVACRARGDFGGDMVREDRRDIDPQVWTPNHLVGDPGRGAGADRRAHLCQCGNQESDLPRGTGDRSWLSKVRPMWGDDYHFHVRIKCPAGSGECEGQPEPSDSEGSAVGDFAFWFKDLVLHPKPSKEPPKPRPPMTLAQLPAACRQVLAAPDAKP